MTLSLCDLHIHSRYARATSTDCAPQPLDAWARRKGLHLIGTGDCTHAAWRGELREALEMDDTGLYRLKNELRLPVDGPSGNAVPHFVITGEISTIYKKNGKTRKVHHVVLLPSLEAADAFAARLEGHGANLHSDGRPILGLDSRDLFEMLLDACPQAMLIPAHIWTPHFSLFGAFSGFDTIEECYEDLTPHIHALETGLSSDPSMNWQLSCLDKYLLVSNSDAHSPAKLGREATLLKGELSYEHLYATLSGQRPEAFGGTIEFYPEEGKYHFDGHRNCQVCLSPSEAEKLQGLCPVCGKRLTPGVFHRVCQLADRPEGFVPPSVAPFERLVPLAEIAAASLGVSAASKKAEALYHQCISQLGSEFDILRSLPLEEAEHAFGPAFREGLRRGRQGDLHIAPGYDGEFGRVALFAPGEREAFTGQTSFLAAQTLKPKASAVKKSPAVQPAPAKKTAAKSTDQLNAEQLQATQSTAPATAVIAGPGTGKTKTLTSRVMHLIEQGVAPGEIACVTFTQKAAQEMQERLTPLLPKKAAQIRIGTFHSLCLKLLGGTLSILSPEEQGHLAQELIAAHGWDITPAQLLKGLSRFHATQILPPDLPLEAPQQYQARLAALDAVDFDTLLTQALEKAQAAAPGFTHLLVDEFQDVSPLQYQLTLAWARHGQSLFVIGDPDQAIYGFRGADSACFDRLQKDLPQLAVITLKETYRSTPQVLACAQQAIRPNGLYDRPLHPNRSEGAAVRGWQAATDLSEALAIAKEINRQVGGVTMHEADQQHKARSFGDIAVLCRTHRQLEIIEHCLGTEGVPYTVTGRGDQLAQQPVQGAVGFFRFLLNPQDLPALRLALTAGMNLSEKVAARLAAQWQASQSLEGCPSFWDLADSLRPLLRRDKPARLIAAYAQWQGLTGDPALEHLMRTALCYPDMPALLNALLLGEEGDLARAGCKTYRADAITLSTLHASKGLEFPVVFLAGLKNGLLPLDHPGMQTDFEEERRLFYVGVTRAQEELILSCGGTPSLYWNDLSLIPEKVGPAKAPQGKQLSFF